MKLYEYRFLTDENIPFRVLYWLKNKGFDVFDIKKESLSGTSDEDIVPIAEKDGRVIITQDSDLATILFQKGIRNAAVIFVRPGHVSSEKTIETLEYVFSLDVDFTIPFILVAENTSDSIKIRVRQL